MFYLQLRERLAQCLFWDRGLANVQVSFNASQTLAPRHEGAKVSGAARLPAWTRSKPAETKFHQPAAGSTASVRAHARAAVEVVATRCNGADPTQKGWGFGLGHRAKLPNSNLR